MIYLENTTSAQTINIPYPNPDKSVTKKVQNVKSFTANDNGEFAIYPDSGFTSMEKVNLTVDKPISGGTIIFEGRDFFDYTNDYTFNPPVSGLTVDAQNFGDTLWNSGYRNGRDNVIISSIELAVSANGVYNATIGPEGEGLFKKVVVNIPSSGGTEPFFGKVARVENRYLRYFSLPHYLNDTTIFNFIIGSLPSSAGTGYTELFYSDSEGTDSRYFDEGEPFRLIIDAFISYGTYSTVGPAGYFLVIDMEVRDKNNDELENPSLAVRVALKDEIQIKFKYTTNLVIDVINKTTGTNGHIWPDEEDMRRNILPTAMWFFEENSTPTSGVFYFKSYQCNSTYGETAFVMPRSDGKLWDVNAGIQSNIVWDDGVNTGNTFTTLYEWEIQ